MKNKRSLTESILNNISAKEIKPLEKDIDEVKLDLNSFIMVPINHPRINDIIALLNDTNTKIKVENKITSQKPISNKKTYDKVSNLNSNNKDTSENIRLIITLNDVLNKYNQEQIIIPKNSIITPLAKDYIKQNKIEIVFD